MTPRDAMYVALSDDRAQTPSQIIDVIERELAARSFLIVSTPRDDGAAQLN